MSYQTSTKKLCLFIGICCLFMTSFSVSKAQTTGTIPMIVTPHNQKINYRERTLHFAVQANVNYTLTSNTTWLKASHDDTGNVTLHVDQNMTSSVRTALVTFTHNDLVKQITLTQGADESQEYITDDSQIYPSSATANVSQTGQGVEMSYDKSYSTLYHSPWSGFTVSESNPVVLTYNFTNVPLINSLTYVPRTDGNSNGLFNKVAVYYKLSGESSYTLYNTYTFGGISSSSTVSFGKTGLVNPVSIQVKVLSGVGSMASCAEMEFRRESISAEFTGIFSDNLLTTLKAGTTAAQIDTIGNPFIKALATQIYNKTYTTDFRVGTYSCILSPYTLSSEWNAPGKYYDQLNGVTGINVTPGKHVVVVSGLPTGGTIPMRVVSWFSQDLAKNDKGETVGGGPADYNFVLHNGLNVINYSGTKDGLAYILYYATTDSAVAASPDIKVHFVNGQVNGYLTPDKTNAQLDNILANATNRCIDLVGSKVHSVWEASALRQYCLSTTSQPKAYRQYMNVLDTLVKWEQELLGFYKYNRVPKNRTMAYVNYTYYMFQGNYGVSFKYDNQSRVLNCNTLVYNDDDAIWGLSHEWGHQHQMTPYFCWTGESESTNNMNSCYNVLHMGYSGTHGARIQNNWDMAYDEFVAEKSYYDTSGNLVYYPGKASSARHAATLGASAFSWCKELQDSALKQDSVITSVSKDAEHAVATNEVYVEQNTAPFFMLYCYFTKNGVPDYAKDMYESLRQTDNENGSTIEKTDGVDKYELLASASNGNKNGKLAVFKSTYPKSCWTTNGYIGSSYQQNSVPFIFNYIRKVSRISGYNLFPFFDKFGFLRQVILTVDDYGTKHYAMTKLMKDEFKADMEALNLKTMDNTLFEKIAHASIPTFTTPVFPE